MIVKDNKFKYDVIIPVGAKDVSFVPRVISYAQCNLIGAISFVLLTNKKYVKRLSKDCSKYANCIVVDEDELLKGLCFDEVRSLLHRYAPGHEGMTGWYFQQFLKLGIALTNYSSDYYVTWDADTLPLRPISFFDGKHFLYNPKHELNPNYFSTISKLLHIEKSVDDSFISESMIFSKKIVIEMLTAIESSSEEGSDWIDLIIRSCDFTVNLQCFSEFETYGNFCAKKYPGLYAPRYLNTFREAGLIRGRLISDTLLTRLSFDLDMASFELQDMPPFPYCIPNYVSFAQKRINRLLSMSLKDLFNRSKK